tara:strand:- start:135 stop:350 length:216 start_codon:yes stop_codon:yes gene_type:complete
MDKWNPSQEQQTGSISRTFEIFINELIELQDELNCPDDFIIDFLDVVSKRWSSDSCHSKARRHKKDNPTLY